MFWKRSVEKIDFLIVGIGNPGPDYARTRHNVGFRVVEVLAKRWGVRRDEARFQSIFAVTRINGNSVGLLKPLTYVNLSGASVQAAVQKLKLPLERLLIVLDDVNLPLGKLRLRPKGSDGGHKGLRSILHALQTDAVPRLRIGVGIPPKGEDLVAFVLSPFAPEEEPLIADAIEKAADAVQVWLTEGMDVAMQKFNR